MVRLTDDTAMQILLLLGVIKARTPKDYTLRSAGLDFTEALQSNTTEVREGFNDTSGPLIQDAIYRSSRERWIDTKVVTIANQLATQILESQSKVNLDRNLIDELAEALRMPLPENKLGNINIDRMQRAILTPSELKGANKVLEDDLACITCGHRFHSGEVASPRNWDRGNHTVLAFTCVNCNTPVYIRCSEEGCDNYVDAGKARLGKANYCPSHASPKSIHDPNEQTIAARHQKAVAEVDDNVKIREARDRATRVRYIVDPNAPPQRGGGRVPTFRTTDDGDGLANATLRRWAAEVTQTHARNTPPQPTGRIYATGRPTTANGLTYTGAPEAMINPVPVPVPLDLEDPIFDEEIPAEDDGGA